MSFWTSFNASSYAYREFTNSIRGRRFTLGSIEGVLTELNRWHREFESLQSEAAKERNQTAAIGKINEVLNRITEKINQMLDLRNRLTNILRETQEKIPRLEESIRRLDESIKNDYNQLTKMRNGTDAWRKCNERIKEKDTKLKNMRESLSMLRRKATDLESR